MATSPRKIIVIGNSCAGKTTFSRRLSAQLKIPHIELDALFWEEGWREAPLDLFRSRVQEALNENSWIVDGNYQSKVKDLVWSQADAIVWLDPNLPTILRRFFVRSLRRSARKEMLWGKCRENLRNSLLKRNSLFRWILKTHKQKRLDGLALLQNPPTGVKFTRLRSNREMEAFLKSEFGH